MSIRYLLLSLTALLSASADALDTHQQQAILHPTTSTPPQPTTQPTAHGYSYVGCWNETVGFRKNGGLRALAEGKDYENEDMTISTCLEFCSIGINGRATQYAGLELGRECYCSTSLSPQSEKLNETTRCTLSCAGNASEICGGKLALTLYNLTMIDSKIGVTGVGWSQFSSVAGYGTLAFVTFVLAAVM